jgi:ABC-type sugar transport system substrate-binding protein
MRSLTRCVRIVAVYTWVIVMMILTFQPNLVKAEAAGSPADNIQTFAIVPKSIDNPFFDVALDGCMDQARVLGVRCLWTGPPADVDDQDGTIQAQIVDELLDQGDIDGLSISCKAEESCNRVIQRAVQLGIPVTTFDSDAPESGRAAYIGTDNYFFGTQIAKVLKQLTPDGGTFAVLAMSSPNLQERTQGFRDEILTNGLWKELPGSPSDMKGNLTLSMEQMQMFADMNPTAIAPVMGAPMRSGSWKEFVQFNKDKGITLVSGDAMPNQLDFLARNYVDGLAGQLPYEMGYMTIETLKILADGGTLENDIMSTNVLTHLKVPLVLPELEMDNNLIGNLHVVGYILFGIVVSTALFCAAWTLQSRKNHVVRASQPIFLVMVCVGVLVMASSLIPLSFDDHGDRDSLSDREGALICMSTPWLACSGFTVTFAALFSKTMRINRLFHSRVPFGRMKVTVWDVMVPFMVLFTMNTVVLTVWTVLDPLVYTREDLPGMDGWNRIIATYGTCHSNHVAPYLVPLGVINLSVLVIAKWQAYEARSIQSEFSESKYIDIALASLLQATLTGIPVLLVVRESPQAYYLTLTFTLFVICMTTLLLIFVPKINLASKFRNEDSAAQNQRLMRSIRQSQASIEMRSAAFRASTHDKNLSRCFAGSSMVSLGPEMNDDSASRSNLAAATNQSNIASEKLDHSTGMAVIRLPVDMGSTMPESSTEN